METELDVAAFRLKVTPSITSETELELFCIRILFTEKTAFWAACFSVNERACPPERPAVLIEKLLSSPVCLEVTKSL